MLINNLAREKQKGNPRAKVKDSHLPSNKEKLKREKAKEVRKEKEKVERKEKVIHKLKSARSIRRRPGPRRINNGTTGIIRRIRAGQKSPSTIIKIRKQRLGGQRKNHLQRILNHSKVMQIHNCEKQFGVSFWGWRTKSSRELRSRPTLKR